MTAYDSGDFTRVHRVGVCGTLEPGRYNSYQQRKSPSFITVNMLHAKVLNTAASSRAGESANGTRLQAAAPGVSMVHRLGPPASAAWRSAVGHCQKQRGRTFTCSAQQSADPYVAAGYRLQSLTSGVGDGEDELYHNMLLEEDPVNKLQVQAVLAALCITASTTICWLCGKDPAGGASLGWSSLQAAAVGAAAAIPLVVYKLGSWLPETQASDASLSALRKAQTENAKPWLYGLDRPQLAAHVFFDTLPPLFLMLPAAQAGLNSSFAFTRAALGNATGVALPEEVGFMLALLVTGLVAAAARSSELMTDPEQVQVVSDAVANADRYYRVMVSQSSGVNSSSSSSLVNQELEAARAALAFKAVAVCWREQESEIMRLCVTQEVLDFLYLGALWYATGDMTAPCVAALLANTVDYHHMWTAIQAGRTGGPGGRGRRGGKHAPEKSSLRE